MQSFIKTSIKYHLILDEKEAELLKEYVQSNLANAEHEEPEMKQLRKSIFETLSEKSLN